MEKQITLYRYEDGSEELQDRSLVEEPQAVYINPYKSAEIGRIVPLASCIKADRVCIYEINDDGAIRILPVHNGIPSDENFLNMLLADTNSLYDQLQEIEENEI